MFCTQSGMVQGQYSALFRIVCQEIVSTIRSSKKKQSQGCLTSDLVFMEGKDTEVSKTVRKGEIGLEAREENHFKVNKSVN